MPRKFLKIFSTRPAAISRTHVVQLTVGFVAVFATLASAPAQSVSFSGTAAVNFGGVNVCPSGQASPSPCSKNVTLTFNVTASGTLGTPKVLTLGAPNLDYTLATGSTCTGAVTASSSCTVNVTFAPIYAGERAGAVEITDGSGTVLATAYIHGTGEAPQIGFSPSAQTTVPNEPYPAGALTVDGSGNLYAVVNPSGGSEEVVKAPAGGGALTKVSTGVLTSDGLAVDGAGNLFIADTHEPRVVEVPEGGGMKSILPFTALIPDVLGLTVSSTGDVYLAADGQGLVLKLPWTGSGYGSQTTVGVGDNPDGTFPGPGAVAVDGNGNVFIASDGYYGLGVEVPSGCTESSCQITLGGLEAGGPLAVDGTGDVFSPLNNLNVVEEIPAGGSAAVLVQSAFTLPGAATVDSAGNLFIAESYNPPDLPAPPVIKLLRSQPPALAFVGTGSNSIGKSTPQSVRIQNFGNQPLVLSGLNVSGNFLQVPGSGTPADCTPATTIAPHTECNLSIVFTPQSIGADSGAVVLTDNSVNASGANQTIVLTGNASSPPQAKASHDVLDFGLVSQPFSSNVKGVTITNIGTGTLTINPSIDGPSAVLVYNDCGYGIIAGNNCELIVEFTPIHLGPDHNTLTIATNGPTNPKIPIRGTYAGVGSINTSLNFGTVAGRGHTATASLTVTNYGVSGSITVATSTGAVSFKVISNSCSSGITSGQSCQIQVEYEPTAQGTQTAYLKLIPSTGPAQDIRMTGTLVP